MTERQKSRGNPSAFFVVADVDSQYVDDANLLLYRII